MDKRKKIGWITNAQILGCILVVAGHSFSVFILSWPVQASIEVLSNKILHLNACICMFLMFSFGIIVPLTIIYYVRLIDKKLNTNKLSLIIGA